MAKENSIKIKGNQPYGNIYLPMISQTRVWSPKYIKNSHDSTPGRQTTQLENGQKTWTDTSPNRAQRHMKRCSASLAIRDMQIKTIMRYHFTSVRMAIITKSTNNKCCSKVVEKRNTSTLLVGVQTGAAAVENSMEFPQKTKNGTALCHSNSAAGIIP